MITENDIKGLEYDWLAVDAEGCVALFTTAGGGYAPAASFGDTESYDAAIVAILGLPARKADPLALRLGEGTTNTWGLVAERGLYAFDSDYFGGPYRIMASPNVPIRVTELPAEAAAVANRVVFRDLRFRDARELTEEQLRRALTGQS